MYGATCPGGAGGGFWALSPLLLPRQQHGGLEAAQTNHADLFPFLWPRKEIDAELRTARQTASWHEDKHSGAAPVGAFQDPGSTQQLPHTRGVLGTGVARSP